MTFKVFRRKSFEIQRFFKVYIICDLRIKFEDKIGMIQVLLL